MATEVASECGDRIFDLAGVAHPDHAQLRTDGRYGLDCGKLTNSGGHVGISQHRDPCQGRCDLFEQLQPFSRDRVLEYGEGGVAENQLHWRCLAWQRDLRAQQRCSRAECGAVKNARRLLARDPP
jgi:hypothetical protein